MLQVILLALSFCIFSFLVYKFITLNKWSDIQKKELEGLLVDSNKLWKNISILSNSLKNWILENKLLIEKINRVLSK